MTSFRAPLGIVVVILSPISVLGQSSKNVIALPFERCVVGAPLTATLTLDYEPTQNSSDPVKTHRDGTLYRNSEGRTRTELKYPNQPLWVFVQDCVAGFSYQWRVGDTAAIRIKMRQVGPPYRARAAPKLDDGENTAMIEGVPTRHSHRTLKETEGRIQQYVEYWYAPSLDLYLMEVMCSADIGKTTWRTSNLSLGEPDPALFQVPAGMSIKDDGPTPPEKPQ
jgi:hypothetical protein